MRPRKEVDAGVVWLRAARLRALCGGLPVSVPKHLGRRSLRRLARKIQNARGFRRLPEAREALKLTEELLCEMAA